MPQPRILVTALGHIADALTATPVLRALRERYPRAPITVLTFAPLAGLWEGQPEVAQVLTVRDRSRGVIGKWQQLAATAALLPRLWRRFDVVLVLQAGGGANALAFLSGARVRAGFDHRRTGWMLTVRVPHPEGETPREANLRVVRALGVVADDPRLSLTPGHAARERAAALLARLLPAGDGPLVAVHPGSDWGCQMWGASRWSDVIDDLSTRRNARVVITGVAGERHFAEQIAAGCRYPPAVACGETDPAELAALLSAMALVIGVESGPIALAVSVGVPAVTLNALYYDFEASPWGRLAGDGLALPVVARDDGSHRWYGDCRLAKLKRERGCVNPPCIGAGVMGEITVARVIAAIDLHLAAQSSPSPSPLTSTSPAAGRP